MSETLHLVVGNDNGNSEHDLIINGNLIQAPNVNTKVDKLPWGYDNTSINLTNAINDLEKNILVHINSDAVPTKAPYHKVGYFAFTEDVVSNMKFNQLTKYDSDLPVVNTLSQLAVYGIKEQYKTDKSFIDKQKLEITVDMCTALPVTQYTEETARKFRDKFLKGKHVVTVYIHGYRVDVDIKFEYVKVLPEGVPAVFAVEDIATLKSLEDKIILHCDIGDGTTEYPFTDGIEYKKEFIENSGSDNGVGHAINKALVDFKKKTDFKNCSRQEFSDIIKNPEDRFNKRYIDDAKECLAFWLEQQAEMIYDKVVDQLDRIKRRVDNIFVYGGGSILMKPHLEDKINSLIKDTGIELVYCPTEYAVLLNANGLYKFATSDIFNSLKSNYKKVAK